VQLVENIPGDAGGSQPANPFEKIVLCLNFALFYSVNIVRAALLVAFVACHSSECTAAAKNRRGKVSSDLRKLCKENSYRSYEVNASVFFMYNPKDMGKKTQILLPRYKMFCNTNEIILLK